MKVNWLLTAATAVVAGAAGMAQIAQAQVYSLSDRSTVAEALMVADGEQKDTHQKEMVQKESRQKGGCDDFCGCSACCDPCGDEPWRLFPALPGGITATGWIAAGGTLNGYDPTSKYNGTVTFNDRNEFQVNQLYAVIQRETDTSCRCLDIGGRVDLLYGSDYIFTQGIGLETRRNGDPKWNSHPQYGLALPQMYAELAINDLSVIAGHFYTIIGNEVVTAPDNFFYSHAYTMQYGEPFTHTGVLATWEPGDRLKLIGGIHNGWDNFDAETERAAFLGGVTVTSLDERFSLAFAITSGDEINNQGFFSNRTMYSIVGSVQLTDRLTYVIQHDHGWQNDDQVRFGEVDQPEFLDAEWYGLNQYLLYTINDCWAAGVRLEWFRDDDGVRVAGVRDGNPAGVGDFVGNFYEATVGLRWTPTANLIVRPEVRWDWFDGDEGFGNPNPFNDLTRDNQFTAAFDAILLY